MTKENTTVQNLKIGSNTFKNFNRLFEIRSGSPLEVGGGLVPIISINLELNGNWIPLVEENVSNTPSIVVIVRKKMKSIEIFAEGVIIINAYSIDEDNIEILNLDLRPLGLNIFKEGDILGIGNTRFSGNSFEMNGTVFKLA